LRQQGPHPDDAVAERGHDVGVAIANVHGKAHAAINTQ